MKKLIISLAVAMSACCAGVYADVAQYARQAMDEMNYKAAADSLRKVLKSNPGATDAGQLNALLGEALYLGGERGEATAALNLAAKRGVADAHRWLGRMAAEDYDFAGATAQYDKYLSLKNKAGKIVDPAVAVERSGAETGRQQLGRVQRLEVIDSIVVPKDGFFKAYRIPRSSGRLLRADQMPDGLNPETTPDFLFANENGDFVMWAAPDSTGVKRLQQGVRLTDGTWQVDTELDDALSIGESDYPFMMPDGTTLYFAARGEHSIGGYDIFIATRDPSDDTYLSPQNLGMPINSPYDDYMLAIDEENNVGWWATDRNRLGEDITIYLFRPWEIRETYPEETENIKDLARLTSIAMTQPEGADYKELLCMIAEINPDVKEEKGDFEFPIRKGVVYTKLSDFTSESAAERMEEYLKANEALDEIESDLRTLRHRYHEHRSQSLTRQILEGEKRRDEQVRRVRQLRGEVISLEKK